MYSATDKIDIPGQNQYLLRLELNRYNRVSEIENFILPLVSVLMRFKNKLARQSK